MKVIRKVLTGAVAVAGLVAVAPSAMAAGTTEGGVTADGRVHAYASSYKGGTHCSWEGNDDNWSTCNGGNLYDRASSLYNTGYAETYDDVNFYYLTSRGGAWACLGRGDYWADLGLNREHFSWGSGKAGYGSTVNNNVRSHKWVSYCGQA